MQATVGLQINKKLLGPRLLLAFEPGPAQVPPRWGQIFATNLVIGVCTRILKNKTMLNRSAAPEATDQPPAVWYLFAELAENLAADLLGLSTINFHVRGPGIKSAQCSPENQSDHRGQ